MRTFASISTARRLRRGDVAVTDQNVGDLLAYRADRVQRGARALEYDRQLAPADLGHFLLGDPDQVEAAE
jgi:hypothetical protein